MIGRAHLPPHQSGRGGGTYVIQVHGEVERHWEDELRMRLTYSRWETGTVSTLVGRLPDQSALLGALGWLAMWGYRIILVHYTPDSAQSEASCA